MVMVCVPVCNVKAPSNTTAHRRDLYHPSKFTTTIKNGIKLALLTIIAIQYHHHYYHHHHNNHFLYLHSKGAYLFFQMLLFQSSISSLLSLFLSLSLSLFLSSTYSLTRQYTTTIKDLQKQVDFKYVIMVPCKHYYS